MGNKIVKKIILGAIFVFIPLIALSQNSDGQEFTIEATTEYQDSRPAIKLAWTAKTPSSYGYIVEEGVDENRTILGIIDTPETNEESTGGYYIDEDVEVGETYNYTITPFDTLGNTYATIGKEVTVENEESCEKSEKSCEKSDSLSAEGSAECLKIGL